MTNKILSPPFPMMMVDDEFHMLNSFEIVFRKNGYNNLLSCQDSRKVLALLSQQEMEIILLDLSLPHISGQELLEEITEDFPELPVIIVTGNNEIETAVECIKHGAFEYLVKPVEEDRLVTAVKRAIELRELRKENIELTHRIFSHRLEHAEAFSEIITANPKMHAIFQYTEAIAKSTEPVLVTGETGVGKELIARVFHTLSTRKGKFLSVNVAGLDDHLFSDTLFGHKKGAYTDAYKERRGLVEQAAGGTLFLDEIGDLNAASQVKLLRLLQEHEYYPLGSDVPSYSDVRVIAATNRDIHALQESGRFRKDLFYRLKVHHVHLPPLRERLGDLPLLIHHFLEEAARKTGKKKPTPPEELPVLLSTYDFPGNIRELRSMVFDAVSAHTYKKLSMDKFKQFIDIAKKKPGINVSNRDYSQADQNESADKDINTGHPLGADDSSPLIFFSDRRLPTLKQANQILVDEAMSRAQGNQSIAADILGISRQALNKRLKEKEMSEKKAGKQSE